MEEGSLLNKPSLSRLLSIIVTSFGFLWNNLNEAKYRNHSTSSSTLLRKVMVAINDYCESNQGPEAPVKNICDTLDIE